MSLVFHFLVSLPVVLLALYSIGIQYERTSLPLWVQDLCEIVACFALVLDVAANFSVLCLYMLEFPRKGEWTFSQRLERLVLTTGWRGKLACKIAKILNRIAPEPHIKNYKDTL
jgi:predicted ferric reductase